MTDLERAATLVKELTFRWCTQDPCLPEELDALVADALAAARREGAEAEAHRAKIVRELDIAAFRAALADMRERAAQTAESDDWSDVYGWNPVALSIAKTIRTIPLTLEEPHS